MSTALEIVNSMTNSNTYYNRNTSININVVAGVSYGGAMGPGSDTMELSINSIYNVDVFVHELSHAFMQANGLPEIYSIDQLSNLSQEEQEIYDNVIKFMEFCTHSPLALWRWMGLHNYPVISSRSYNYFYNHFVVAAWEVMYPQTQ